MALTQWKHGSASSESPAIKEPLRALFCLCPGFRFLKGRACKRQNTVVLVVTFQAATNKISLEFEACLRSPGCWISRLMTSAW